MQTILKKTEKTYLITELQRRKKSVIQLQKNLNSYQCVPKTSFLFNKMAALKNELNTLSSNTESLLATLQVNGILVVDYIDNVEEQFKNFNKLYNEIEEYIKSAKQ